MFEVVPRRGKVWDGDEADVSYTGTHSYLTIEASTQGEEGTPER